LSLFYENTLFCVLFFNLTVFNGLLVTGNNGYRPGYG